MAKVFISCPIQGRSYNEIFVARSEAFYQLEDIFPNENLEIIDSFIPEMYYDVNNNPVIGIGTCISLMGNADCVFMCKGWKDARGCRIEHMVAEEYGIPILYEK